eukprot:m51a1_g10528 hypothetical protein (336) ;mRNA; r:232059-233310
MGHHCSKPIPSSPVDSDSSDSDHFVAQLRVWTPDLPHIRDIGDDRIFWVECNRIAATELLRAAGHSEGPEGLWGASTARLGFTFAATADLVRLLQAEPEYYPWSGQWNGYSPFRDMPECAEGTYGSREDLLAALGRAELVAAVCLAWGVLGQGCEPLRDTRSRGPGPKSIQLRWSVVRTEGPATSEGSRAPWAVRFRVEVAEAPAPLHALVVCLSPDETIDLHDTTSDMFLLQPDLESTQGAVIDGHFRDMHPDIDAVSQDLYNVSVRSSRMGFIAEFTRSETRGSDSEDVDILLDGRKQHVFWALYESPGSGIHRRPDDVGTTTIAWSQEHNRC